MGRYGDPDALEASARGLGADADGVRRRARSLERSVATMRWQGPAATAFRHAVDRDVDGLHRAARELDEAAAELRAHAAQVRERAERIAAIERAVTGWLDDRLPSLDTWGRLPEALPMTGDRGWLDVGDHLRGLGLRW